MCGGETGQADRYGSPGKENQRIFKLFLTTKINIK
jgi:hypothetical protein